MTKTLLIPTARIVAPELIAEFGPIATGLIPLDGRPALQYVIDHHHAQGLIPVIAADAGREPIIEFVQRHPEYGARVVCVGATASLGETILRALEALPTSPEYLVINFADTLVTDELPPGDVVCYVDQDDIFRWTTFELDPGGRIVRIVDKDRPKQPDKDLHVFVGLFAIANPPAFQSLLAAAVAARSGDTDPFYVSLSAYLRSRGDPPTSFLRVKNWRDFGHLDTYCATKRAHFINSRFFNDVEVDERRGLVRKGSADIEKLRAEINWYIKLPKSLGHLAPRVIDFDLEVDSPYLTIEFYGYPSLNDLFLHANLNLGVWQQILGALDRTLEDLQSHRLEPSDTSAFRDAMRRMYEEKTRRRLNQLPKEGPLARFDVPTVMINGQPCPGVRSVLDTLPALIERVQLYGLRTFTIIHGDFCLSNILYDRRHGIVRLIDPRGGFGSFDIYGDPRYDLAKLCHSILGHYDFFVNGLFTGGWSADGYRYRLYDNQQHTALRDLFRRRVVNHHGQEIRQIRLIEGLLFLSMVPLHADRLGAQEAFLARGLELLASVARDGARETYAEA